MARNALKCKAHQHSNSSALLCAPWRRQWTKKKNASACVRFEIFIRIFVRLPCDQRRPSTTTSPGMYVFNVECSYSHHSFLTDTSAHSHLFILRHHSCRFPNAQWDFFLSIFPLPEIINAKKLRNIKQKGKKLEHIHFCTHVYTTYFRFTAVFCWCCCAAVLKISIKNNKNNTNTHTQNSIPSCFSLHIESGSS